MVRLTRRGWATVGLVVLFVAMALAFGGRALDAVVMPLVLALVAAVVAVARTDPPDVTRRPIEDGAVGTTRTVELDFQTKAPLSGVVDDETDEGVAVSGLPVETTVGDRPVGYEAAFRERGAHDFGPVTLRVTDVLGLASVEFTLFETDTALAYPRTRELTGASRSELAKLAGEAVDEQRKAFDRLREYESGDSLRDVHWKSSAKRPPGDLVVKEFVAEDDIREVTVAGRADGGHDDAMAEAVATIAVQLLSIGVAVGVALPGGHGLDPDVGTDHRRRLLELLAVVGPGDPPGDPADVSVDARPEELAVRIGDRDTTFAALVGEVPGQYAGAPGGSGAADPRGTADEAGSRPGRRSRSPDPVADGGRGSGGTDSWPDSGGRGHGSGFDAGDGDATAGDPDAADADSAVADRPTRDGPAREDASGRDPDRDAGTGGSP